MNNGDKSNRITAKEKKFTFSYYQPKSKKTYAELANELVEDTIRKVLSNDRTKHYN